METVRSRNSGAQRYALGLTVFAVLLSACSEERSTLESSTQALHDGAPPYWQGGTGPAVHYAPVAWPTEPAPSACGATCGEWLPYTRFQNSLNDPRTQDPSNGGTSPQNHVNIASSCEDKTLPSIYYSLRKHATDPSKDVLMFRWRVARDAHTYATGPSPGAFRSGDAWSSALWTVLFNLDGSGYRTLAAHINGSAGSPSAPVDTLAGIYGKIPTQSINYLDDPDNIKLLGTQPTAFVNEGNDFLLNFQNNLDPKPLWPNGAEETVWDYGTTRARLVSTRPCTEYFIDYQIPVAMLDATSQGGPKVTRSTPISMLFCTANSLNNPFQKDCALNRKWTASTNAPGPFGDFISFDQKDPYAQPLITAVTAQAPSTCAETYALTAKVQDALWVNSQQTVEPSVKAVSFWYYHDANGDGASNDGSSWTKAVDATLTPGKLNEWRASWDSRGLPRGSYLIGVQALDDNTRVDDGMVPSGVDNRTFSYVASDSLGQVYIGGAWKIDQQKFPGHSPAMAPRANENWYGNPLITGVQIVGTGVDMAINSCGIAPGLGMTADRSELTPGERVNLTILLSNPSNSPFPVNVSSIVGQLPPGFTYVSGSTSGPFGSADPVINGNTLTWTLSPAVPVAPGASATLTFGATASTVAGSYNAQSSAATSFGGVSSEPVPLTVYAARASLTQTPSRYQVKPDGTTPVTYTLTYANESSVSLSNATLTNALPANVNFVGCTGGSTCAFSGGQVTWQLGTLAAGAKGSATFTLNVAPAFTATSLTNVANLQATVPGGSQLQRSSTSTITVEQPVPAFSLSMTSSAVRIGPGTTVTWTMTYANQGTGAATGSFLVDKLPDGFTFTSCSVTGSTHFTGCTNSSGTVTFHGTDGAAGAGVTVGIGASGTVTLTATAASPFTYTNPGVNSATISASGGRGAAQAQSSVGVTGQYCSNVYYFRRGVDNNLPTIRPASVLQPTNTANYTTFISTTSSVFGSTDQVVFRQEQPMAQDTTLSGLQLTVDFALGATQGGGRTRVLLENATTGQIIATSAELTVNNSPTSGVWYQYAVTIPTTPVVKVLKGEQLRWVFQFRANGGTRDITFYYDSVTYQSRSSFCAATSPASLTVSNTVDKARIAGPVEKLTYTLKYANAGGSSASNVVLSDVLPAGMTACEYSTNNGSTWLACSGAASNPQRHDLSLGALASGASGTVLVRGDSPALTTPGQTLVNMASIVSTETPTPVSATASTSVTAGTQPMLVITGGADKSTVGPAEKVTYTFTVKNVGTGPATNVVVSNTIPVDMPWYQYVPGSITGGTSHSVSGNTLSWTLGNLAVDATATLTFQMDTPATGLPSGLTARDDLATLSDSSYCTGSSAPASCTSNTVTVMVDGKANLTLSSSATPVSVSPGQAIDFTLMVGSAGSSTATDVVLVVRSDSLPRYTRFDSITEGSGSYDAVTNRVVFTLGDLPPGQTVQRKFRVRVEDSLPGGVTPLVYDSSVRASNAQLRTSSVQLSATAEPKMSLVSTGPASLPGPAARLAASASGATTLKVDSGALLEVGGYLLVNGTVAQVTGIAGTTVTVSSPVTGSLGDPLWRSAAYALSFANTGNATAESVAITSALPAGWLYVTSQPAASAAPGVGTTGNVSWNLGGVAAGESSLLQIVAIPTLTGTLPSTVADSRSCTSGSTSGCSDSVTTTVGGLIAKKRTNTSVVSVGSTASYTITLENSLNTDVTGVSVTDILPSGFSYRPGSSTPEPTSVAQGQPTWSALTVPAQGQLELTFQVNVDALTGTGTYDNALSVVAPTGVGVTPFDPLGTTAEDVTVVGNGSFVAAGYVFRDRPTLGVLDDADTGLVNVVVNINDGSPTPYILQTDDFGYFRRVLPAGTWSVSIPTTEASNQQVLNGLTLYSAYSTPVQVTGSNPAATSIRFGYVPTVNATYTVSTQVTEGQGSFSPTSTTVAHSETTTFTVTPATGYVVKTVSGCGGSLAGSLYTTGAITSACTVTATFELKQYTVSTQVVGQGTISPTTATVNHGDTVSFTVTPATGYSLKEVTGCGVTLVNGSYVTAPVTGNCTVTATFELKQYTVSTQVVGQGTISPTTATVNHGDTVSFTVTPATGYSLKEVTGCGVTLVNGSYVTAPVTGNCTVTATFELKQYTVSTQVVGQGTISPTTATVNHGDTASFTVTPATGYSLKEVTGCGVTLVNGSYVTAPVTGNCTVTATFVLTSAPDAVDDSVTVAEDSGATVVNVLANDSSAQLTVTAVTQPTSGGSVTLQGNEVRFTPTANFNGTVAFTYTVSDGNGGTDTATVTVTVTPVNDPPTGVADTYSMPAGSGPRTLDVLVNDKSTPDTGEVLTVTAVTQPTQGGTVSVAPNGTGVVFTPTSGFTGKVTFRYTLSDDNGGTATVTVTVNIGRVDSDNDGVDDEIEEEIGLDPTDPDADDDGIVDNEDGLTDTDGDGLLDALDPDSDNDGLNDGTERGVTASMTLPGTDRSSPNFQPDSDPSTTTDPRNPDSDGDGLKDGTEDADHDGQLDDTESDPNDPDTDHGGLKDGEEVDAGGNPRNYTDDLVVAGRGCSSTGSGALLPLLALLAVPLLRRRQALRGPAMGWGILGLLAAVFVSAPASAQDAAQASQSIDVQQYKPGPSSRDVLNLHSSQVGKHLDWNLGLSFNYARNPLNFLRPRTDDFVYAVVKNQFTFDLMGSIALFDRYELGVAVPITSQGSGPAASVSPLLSDGFQATGVGDLRLIPKVNLLSLDNGLRLGIAVPLLLPTSGGKEFLGRQGVAAFPRVLGEWVFNDKGARVLANVGVNLQPREQFYNLNVGNEFAYGVGAEVPFQVGQNRMAAEASLVGALGLNQASTEERPLELLGALKYHFTDKLAAHLGGGPGLTRGYGTPGFRLFAGVVWTEATRAVVARVEPPPAPVCPLGPEDVDGFQDEDGCADPDNDGDGLLDGADRCPNQPETKNGFEDEDGCADELPPPPPVDSDGDGLTDDKDRCPQVAEDKDGFQDEDGCPDPDNDKDGVLDASDKCPSEPETINGVRDEDGCPDKGKERVRVEGQKILILDKVYFATNKDVILVRSFPLLRQVGQVLRANPQLLKVRVEGHTDSQSSDAFNLDLSQRRANSVRKHLIEKEGIAAERLEAVGYGESKPVDTNKTAAGRENNRRVEFIILEVEKETP